LIPTDDELSNCGGKNKVTYGGGGELITETKIH
jgi:hypothetical protein